MATKANKGNASKQAQRAAVAAQVTKLRQQGNSWAAIGAELGFAPRTARSLYQLANGAHSHHGTLPGKGGRYPQGYVAPTVEAVKGTGGTPWVAGTGQGTAGTMGGATPAAPAKRASRSRKAAAK